MKRISRRLDSLVASAFAPAVLVLLPQLALAQAASPFLTGANSLQTNILAWLMPVAIILIMVLGGMAMANRMGDGMQQALEYAVTLEQIRREFPPA